MPTYVNLTGAKPHLTKAYSPPSEEWITLEEWEELKKLEKETAPPQSEPKTSTEEN